MSKKWNEKVKVEPCPYCGGNPFIAISADGTMYVDAQHSKQCMMHPNTWLLSTEPLENQIKYWNMRVEK